MALYCQDEKRGTGETLLFALEVISNSHTKVFSTYTSVCPHTLLGYFFPLEFPSLSPLEPLLAAPAGAPARRCSHPAPPCPSPGAGTPAGGEARAIPDLWGTLGCQEGGKAMLGALRSAAPRVCSPPSPEPASREELSSGAGGAALGPFLREPHTCPWRWWRHLCHKQHLSGPLLRNFHLLHGGVLIYGFWVIIVHVYLQSFGLLKPCTGS